MSTSMESTAILQGPCGYCGSYHVGACPRVKAYEYFPNGMVKRVEFHDTTPAWPATSVPCQPPGEADET